MLTSGTQEAPAHVDGGSEKAVPLGAAMTAADHDMMGEDDTACGHTAIPRVIGHWTTDTSHQTACAEKKGRDEQQAAVFFFCSPLLQIQVVLQQLSLRRLNTFNSTGKPSPLLALCKSLSKQQVEQMCWGQQNPPPGLLVVPRSFRTQSSW